MSVNELLGIIRRSATEAVEATQPTKIVFGEVTNESPLEIVTDQKIRLTEDFLVLCREVTNYDVEMTVNHQVEKAQGGGGDPSFAAHQHLYKGRKVFKVHKSLKVGEKVLLLAMQGGQTYVVVDRVVGV